MYFPQGKVRLAKFNAILFGCTAVWLCAASISDAQERQIPGPLPQPAHSRLAKNVLPSSAPHILSNSNIGEGGLRQQESNPLAPADTISQSAMLSLRNGELTVEANNSDLTQILQNLSNISGMNIQGMNSGPRIFGVYGPGNVREVLSDLLAGSGYNFVIVGGADGSIPHEVFLTAQNRSASTIVPHKAPSSILSDSVAAEPLQTASLERNEADTSSAEASSTGAISPAPSRNDQDSDSRMQQTLQRLQHIQEQPQDATQ